MNYKEAQTKLALYIIIGAMTHLAMFEEFLLPLISE